MYDNSLVLDLVNGSTNEREFVWLYNRLLPNRPYEEIVLPVTKHEYFIEINKFIENRHFKDITERNKFIRKLKTECASNLLPSQTFKWIDKKNERQCHWIWFTLLLEHQLTPSINASNLQVKYTNIVSFFDLLNTSVQSKLSLLNSLEKLWNDLIHMRFHDYDWLNFKDISQCLWAQKYLEKQIQQDKFTTLADRNLCSSAYAFVMVNIDLWLTPIEDQQIFSNKMRLAWKQKLLRKKGKAKASKTKINISNKYLLMLSEVSELYEHKNENKTLEHMIHKEYEKIRSSWKKEPSA